MSNIENVATAPTSEGREVRVPQHLVDMLTLEGEHLGELDVMAHGWMRWYYERAKDAHDRAEELSRHPGNEGRVKEYRKKSRDFSARMVTVNVWRGELMECRRLIAVMLE